MYTNSDAAHAAGVPKNPLFFGDCFVFSWKEQIPVEKLSEAVRSRQKQSSV